MNLKKLSAMGLNFKNSTAQWSYSGFKEFRNRLANSKRYTTDLFDFLTHSDCDGSIPWEDCMKIALALEKVVDGWEENDHDKINAKDLIETMRECSENKTNLEFI